MVDPTPLRWGIMGTGGIAGAMAGALRDLAIPITAVGSTRSDAACDFADRWHIDHVLDDHEAVARHPDVDVVYVATTNDRHLDNVLACVDARTAVLCEKPLAMGTAQARTMVDAARAAGVFLMEGMWMRFNPHLARMDQLIQDGAIGTPNLVEASLSFFTPRDPNRRWLDPALGGGSVVDLAIYPMSLAHYVLGVPRATTAVGRVGDTGVDLGAVVVGEHDGGAFSVSVGTFDSDTANTAVISGSEGRIVLHSPMHSSARVTLERRTGVVEEFGTGYEGHGFQFEVRHVEGCIRDGRTESPLRPLDHTLEVMAWMDDVRRQIGVRFPTDPDPEYQSDMSEPRERA